MTGYASAALRGREAARDTNTAYKLRTIVVKVDAGLFVADPHAAVEDLDKWERGALQYAVERDLVDEVTGGLTEAGKRALHILGGAR